MMKGKQNKCVSRIPLPNRNLKVSKAIQEFLDFTIVNLCDNSESLTSSKPDISVMHLSDRGDS